MFSNSNSHEFAGSGARNRQRRSTLANVLYEKKGASPT